VARQSRAQPTWPRLTVFTFYAHSGTLKGVLIHAQPVACSSDARYQEMLDDNIPSQKYRDIGIPRYFLVDVAAVLHVLY